MFKLTFNSYKLLFNIPITYVMFVYGKCASLWLIVFKRFATYDKILLISILIEYYKYLTFNGAGRTIKTFALVAIFWYIRHVCPDIIKKKIEDLLFSGMKMHNMVDWLLLMYFIVLTYLIYGVINNSFLYYVGIYK